MLKYIKSELSKFNIDLVSSISLKECEITRPYLLKKKGISNGSVIIFAVPYLTDCECAKTNISTYAASRDYHLFFTSLFDNLIPKLEEKYPENIFAGFTDHSPINEIKAAATAQLGVIGKNNLLITKDYSSFVFIGEIITDAHLPSNTDTINYCENCGLCVIACPVDMDIAKCLSSITQKKGELNNEEISLIKKYECAWGCDICQNACPYTKKAKQKGSIYTNIDFFKNERTPHITSAMIKGMCNEQFSARAYSWRGKNVILRNLKILEGKES